MGGVISYTNGVKHRLLGVSEDTLRVYTAVSRQTAHEMARGCTRGCAGRRRRQRDRPRPGRTAMGQGGPSGLSISGSTWRASPFRRSCI